MAAKPNPKPLAVQPDLTQMEAMVMETVNQTAPTISRAATERNRMELRRNELERELADFNDRRSLLRSQYEAADAALMAQELDIIEALTLFPAQVEKGEAE